MCMVVLLIATRWGDNIMAIAYRAAVTDTVVLPSSCNYSVSKKRTNMINMTTSAVHNI